MTTEVALPNHRQDSSDEHATCSPRERSPTPLPPPERRRGGDVHRRDDARRARRRSACTRSPRPRTRCARAATSGRTRRRTTWPSTASSASPTRWCRRKAQFYLGLMISNTGHPVRVAAGRPRRRRPRAARVPASRVGRARAALGRRPRSPSPTAANAAYASGRRAGQLRPHPDERRLLRRADGADAGASAARATRPTFTSASSR